MLGVLPAPAMQQARRELVLATALGGTLLTRRDLLTDLELELAAERASWHHPAPISVAVNCLPGEDDLTDCPETRVHYTFAKGARYRSFPVPEYPFHAIR
jgi:hypothetical protein